MKACVLEAVGQLIYQDVPDPIPKENEVLLEVKACGICSSDIDRIFKTGTYHFPTIPGHEFSGKIIGFGKGVDPELLGKRAAVFPLLPCFALLVLPEPTQGVCLIIILVLAAMVVLPSVSVFLFGIWSFSRIVFLIMLLLYVNQLR